MTRITTSKDCGNSPKNKFAEDLAIALEKNDQKKICAVITENIAWQLDAELVNGKEAFLKQLSANRKPTKIVIDHAVTHGKVGAVNGISSFGKSNEVRFCHVFEFSNAKCTKLSRVCSYKGCV